MKSLISYEEFKERYADNVLPELNEKTNKPQDYVIKAIEDATGIVVSHLSWLIDKETEDICEKIPAQFEIVVKTICSDIAFIRINDRVSSDEDAKEKYDKSLSLLEKIDKEYKGGLSGPNLQSSYIEDNDFLRSPRNKDKKFFRKGELI